MKKNIALVFVAISIVAGTVMIANSRSQQTTNACPNKPGCICVQGVSGQVETANTKIVSANEDNCSNEPDCICD